MGSQIEPSLLGHGMPQPKEVCYLYSQGQFLTLPPLKIDRLETPEQVEDQELSVLGVQVDGHKTAVPA
jgi:hypothetical protein